jgi:hypothetical protein
MCSIETPEQVARMEELVEMKRRYERKIVEIEERVSSMRHVSTICNMDFKESRTIGMGCNLEEVRQTRDVSLKCNLDEEQRAAKCHVSVNCSLRPEQRDAYVNTCVEQKRIVETRTSATHACIEDPQVAHMSRELERLRGHVNRPVREVGCSMDSHVRAMDNLIRHQSSSMEQIRMWSKLSNTETCQTRDSASGTHRSQEMLVTSKGCQASDAVTEAAKDKQLVDLSAHKARLEYERAQFIELNNELKLRISEWEEKFHAERSRALSLESACNSLKKVVQAQPPPPVLTNVAVGRNSCADLTHRSTSTSNLTSKDA